MNLFECTFVRNSRIYGQVSPLLRKCIEMQTYLKHVYIHETIYKHHLVDDVYFFLIQICNNCEKLQTLYECWIHMKDDEDQSIICGLLQGFVPGDCFLISAIDKIVLPCDY